MLHWICPECGNECEPTARDCPTCYPSDVVLAGRRTAFTSHAVAIAPPPLPPPAPPALRVQPQSVAAIIPAFLMPANAGEQTLRLPVPGFLGAPVQTLAAPPPLPVEPVVTDPVPAGLRALSLSMKAWEPAATVSPLPEAVFGEDARVNGIPSLTVPAAECELGWSETLHPLHPPPFQWSGATSGANALQLSPELEPAPGPVAVPDAPFAWCESLGMAGLQPCEGRPQVRKPSPGSALFRLTEESALAASVVRPAFETVPPLAGQFELPVAGKVRMDGRPPLPRPLPSPGPVCAGVAEFVAEAVPSAVRSTERDVAPWSDFGFHSLAGLVPVEFFLWPAAIARVHNPPAVRGYWPWPGPATPAGKPVLNPVAFEMDPAVLLAVEPAKALMIVPKPEPEPEVLIPIVESAVPSMARLVPLPRIGIRPRSVFLKPGRKMPLPEFEQGTPYIPQRRGARLIASPIYSDAAKRGRTSPFLGQTSPGWLVTAVIALLIPIGALGVVNYWILPAQRASAASTPPPSGAQQPAPAATPADPSASAPTTAAAMPANWKKVLEFTGIRLQDGRAQFIVVNHGKTPIPPATLLVTLRSASGALKGNPPVGSFQIRVAGLGPRESREMSSAVQMPPQTAAGPDIDWTDIRADLQLVK